MVTREHWNDWCRKIATFASSIFFVVFSVDEQVCWEVFSIADNEVTSSYIQCNNNVRVTFRRWCNRGLTPLRWYNRTQSGRFYSSDTAFSPVSFSLSKCPFVFLLDFFRSTMEAWMLEQRLMERLIIGTSIGGILPLRKIGKRE